MNDIKDPTQPGASEDTETDHQEVDPREAAIEDIANRRRDELREEGFNIPKEPTESDGSKEPTKEVPKETAPTDEAAAEPDGETEEMFKIVVDGEEREVPLSKILDAGKKTLQKESAADKRLREATELLNAAKSGQDKQLPAGVVKPPAQDDDLGASEEEIAKIVNDIQYGSSEEGVAATKRLLAMTRTGAAPPTITPMDVESIIEQRDIRTRFKRDFKDIAGDTRLYDMAVNRVGELLQSGEPNTYKTYQKAGSEIHDWFFGPSKTPEKSSTDNVTSLEKKREKKTEIEDVSGTGGTDASPDASAPAMPTAASRSAIIQDEIDAKRRALNS